MPGSIKIDDGSGNYTILTNAGSLGSDKTITIPNETATLATTTASNLGGLVYINSGTFSSTSQLTVENVFTSTYKDYKVLIQVTDNSADDSESSLRLYAGGNITANYISQRLDAQSSTVGGGKDVLGTDEWDMTQLDQSYTYGAFIEVHLRSPQEAAVTHMFMQGTGNYGANALYTKASAGVHTGTDQADGFAYRPTTGTITGNWVVYGMVKS
jgi:hypothetical protein